MIAAIKNFLKSEDGPTAVEYAVMLALIIIACVGAIKLFGSKTNALFERSGTELQNNGI